MNDAKFRSISGNNRRGNRKSVIRSNAKQFEIQHFKIYATLINIYLLFHITPHREGDVETLVWYY